MSLSNYQHKLELHFHVLAGQRQIGSVYLLEHQLTQDELKEMQSLVKDVLRYLRGAGFQHLNAVYFPFLILAVETGYHYQGNGTDFWRQFAEKIGLDDIKHSERQFISKWFEDASMKYKVAQPIETPWTKRYRHIAKPITNAILPLDIRLPFLESLAKLPTKYYKETETSNIVNVMLSSRNSINSYSKRYEEYILLSPIIKSLAVAILTDDQQPNFLTPETLSRIRKDIEADRLTGQCLRQIRDNQKRVKTIISFPPVVEKEPSQKLFTDYVNLFLRIQEEYDDLGRPMCILEGKIPSTVVEMLCHDKELVKILRFAQWKPTGLNGEIKLKPAVFLSQESFEVVFQSIDTPLLDELPKACSEEIRELLKSIRFKMEYPAVFEKVNKNLYRKRAMAKIEINEGVVLCLVSNNEARIIDTDILENIDWAREHGFIVDEKKTWKWIVPFGRIDEDMKRITVSKNEACIFVHNLSNNEITKYNELAEMQTVNVNGESWSIIVSPQEHQSLFTTELIGEASVNALIKRTLSLSVSSDYSFQNLNYTLSLTDGKKIITQPKINLESLPYSIDKNSIFSEAFKEQESEIKKHFWQLISNRQDLKLILNIANVFCRELILETVVNSVWWENLDDEIPKAVSDVEELTVMEVLYQEERCQLYPDDYRLFCAIGANNKPVEKTPTILRCPQVIHFGKILKELQRKLRQENDQDNAIGLRNIVTDMLVFHQVQSNNAITEMVRLRILTELETFFWTTTCGEKWYKEIKETNNSYIYPINAFKNLEEKIESDMFRYNPNFIMDWSVKSLAKYIEQWQKEFLKGSPYHSLWETNVIENVFALFLDSEQYYSQFETQTLNFLLRDRQSVRAICFLLNGRCTIESKWENISDE
jgi:hypothetical protein